MRFVAFFRNVNQGQRGHPSTADLVDALVESGAVDVMPFQSNGTIAFTAPEPSDLGPVVRERLASRGVYDDVIEVRPLGFIEGIVAEHGAAIDGRRRELTLFDSDARLGDGILITRESTRRRCVVVDHGAGWAVILNDRDEQSNGTPTIEAVLGARATSRGLPTLGRLVERERR